MASANSVLQSNDVFIATTTHDPKQSDGKSEHLSKLRIAMISPERKAALNDLRDLTVSNSKKIIKNGVWAMLHPISVIKDAKYYADCLLSATHRVGTGEQVFMEVPPHLKDDMFALVDLTAALGFEDLVEEDKQDIEKIQQELDVVGKIQDKDVANINAKYKQIGINSDYREILIAQKLAQVFAHRRPAEDMLMRIPILSADAKQLGSVNSMQPVTYKVETITVGDNLPIRILTPIEPDSKAPALVIPRPTSPYFFVRQGAFESVQTDVIDPDGVSNEPIIVSSRKLEEKLSSITDDGKRKVTVMGHSLGGFLGQEMGVRFPDYVDRVWAFGSPAVDGETVDFYEKLPLEKTPQIEVFNTVHDLVPKAGSQLLGNWYDVECADDPRFVFFDVVYPHAVQSISADHTLHKIDLQKEETQQVKGGSVREGINDIRHMPAPFLNYAEALYHVYDPPDTVAKKKVHISPLLSQYNLLAPESRNAV